MLKRELIEGLHAGEGDTFTRMKTMKYLQFAVPSDLNGVEKVGDFYFPQFTGDG